MIGSAFEVAVVPVVKGFKDVAVQPILDGRPENTGGEVMYRDSIKLYVRLIKYVLIFVGIELANQILAERAPGNILGNVVSFFNMSALCFIAHQAILLPDRHELAYTYRRLILGFAGGILAMFSIGLVPAIVLAVILISQLPSLLDEEMTVGLTLGLTFLGALFVALVILPLFGTSLLLRT